MNNLDRQFIVRIQILSVLNDCGGHLLPEGTLLTQTQLSLQPAPLQSEFSEALAFLDFSKMVTGVRPALGGNAKWRITDNGLAELANQK